MQRIPIFLLTFLAGTLLASEADIRQVRSLADQGLFETAEILCYEKFDDPNLADSDKILIAAELARSYYLHILLLEPAQRTRILRSLETLENNWLTPPSANALPHLVLAKIILRLQIALAYFSLGDHLRLEADTVSLTNRPGALQHARTVLHNTLERLKICQQELQSLRQRLGNNHGSNADLSLSQRILALEYTITMQQAITRKSLALTFQAEDDRNFELRQAIGLLSPLAAINSAEPIIIQCKIEKAASHRLASELEQCREILAPLFGIAISLACQLRLEAEWLRYQIASGNIAETRRQYAADRENSNLHPDFDIARLELFLASDPARGIRADSPAAMRLEQAIDRQLGSHWARRARLLVAASGNTELNSAEMLAMRGDNHYREEQFAEAARLYEQAAAQADASRQVENMFRYNRLAAHSWVKALEQLPSDEPAIVYQQRIVALLRKLVEQAPAHHEALEFHALALTMQGQVALSQPEVLDDYLTLLAEHSERWRDSPHLPTARRLAVVVLERQGRLDEASAMLPLLDLEELAALPSEIQRLRVRQLDAEGKTQDAVDILIILLNQRRDSATLQLFANILTRQVDVPALHHALNFWRELESTTERNSEIWWSAREGIIVVLIKLDRREDAVQSFAMLRVLYPDLGGPQRKARLVELLEDG